MGDQTPAAGPARLTEGDLASIEERGLLLHGDPFIVCKLLPSLRAAWAELTVSREDYDAAVADLAAAHAEVRRLRAALAHYADVENWRMAADHGRTAWVYDGGRRGDDIAAAALAAPGAGEETSDG